MANPKYMECKANGTVVPFDADMFKTEKYVEYIPEEHVAKVEKPGKPEKPAKAPSAD